MPERWSDYLAIFMSAIAVGYMIYEIDRRQRKLREVFDVLDAEDSEITASLEEPGRPRRATALRRSDARLSAQGSRPSVATGPNTFEITEDRVFGPGGGALARRETILDVNKE